MIKKKRKGWRIILFIMSTSIIIMLMVMFWQWLTERRAGFVHYPEFGISIPRNYSIHGIDVSKYQGTINWQSVKEMNVDDIRIGDLGTFHAEPRRDLRKLARELGPHLLQVGQFVGVEAKEAGVHSKSKVHCTTRDRSHSRPPCRVACRIPASAGSSPYE